jgi:hypothetical protein
MNLDKMETMAHMFTVAAMVVVGFQIALASGAPWGDYAWGGRFPGRLPIGLRLASALSAVIVLFIALIIEIRAGYLFPEYHQLSMTLSWGVLGYCGLGTIMNAITPSKKERRLWLPIVTLLLVTSLAVVFST